MFTCLGCGVTMKGRRERRFCSNRCQRELERSANVARWLETGVAWVDTRPDHYVRGHIKKEQGGLCALCGLRSEWNGLPLVLVLDHVDGDATNNRRENLRSSARTAIPTAHVKMRNMGNGRHSRRQRYADGKSY